MHKGGKEREVLPAGKGGKMLSERLKNRDLEFARITDAKRTKEAKDMIAEVSEMLVIAMRVAEDYGGMDRTEVEEYTLKTLEFYEAKYYTDEDFKKTVQVMVKRG